MAGRNFLFVPGPTNVPDRVQRAMIVAMEDHRSSTFPAARRERLADLEAGLPDGDRRGLHLPRHRHRWLGGGADATRSRPAIAVLASRFGQFSHLWIDMLHGWASTWKCSTVSGARALPRSASPRAARGRQRARDQGRAGRAQRDGHRRHERHRRGAARDGCGEAPRAALRRRRELAREHRLSHGRLGRGPRVTGSQKGLMLPAGLAVVVREPAGAGRARVGAAAAACYFDFGDMIRRQRDRLLPLHAVAAAALWAARVARHALRGRAGTFPRGTIGWRRACARRCRAWELELCARAPAGTRTP